MPKDMSEYIKEVIKTESIPNNMGEKLDKNLTRILHGVIGISTEAGELLDSLKKHIFYDAPLDTVNIKEEIGDILWYISIILDTLNTSYDEIIEANIKKLRARYGESFNKEKTLNRDLKKERDILEKNL